MSRTCQLTGKKAQSGHNVSHSNRKTNRKFQPNLQKVALTSETLGRSVSLRISTRALRTVGKKGGLDAFLLQTADARLPDDAMKLKRQIKRQLSKTSSAKAN